MTFQVERWGQIEAEMPPLMRMHWREIALDHDRIPMEVDFEGYRAADTSGLLHIVTAREGCGQKLAGYYISAVRPHLHYKSTIFGLLDMYFILPEFRSAFSGLGLFQEMERQMRLLGVKSIVSTCKLHHDVGPLFEHLGYVQVGKMYQKWIGD